MRKLTPDQAEVWVARLDEPDDQYLPPNSAGGKTPGGTEAGFRGSPGDLASARNAAQEPAEEDWGACGN